MNPRDLVVTESGELDSTAAEMMIRTVHDALKVREQVHLCLSGDPRLGGLYRRFLAQELPWRRLHLYLAEARTAWSAGTILEGSRIPAPQIHAVDSPAADPEAAARSYAELLPPTFDLVVVALRPDGGVAGLDPGSPAVTDARRKVAPVESSAEAVTVTVTPRVIMAARTVLVTAAGPENAPAVKKALQGPYELVASPAQVARSGVWILDRPASELLDPPELVPPEPAR